MKAFVGAGIAVILMAGGALAQQSPMPEQRGKPDQQDAGPTSPPPPEEHDGWAHHMEGHRRPPPSKAAAFRIEASDLRIGMKCPDDEPFKACADFTLQLLDRLTSMPKH